MATTSTPLPGSDRRVAQLETENEKLRKELDEFHKEFKEACSCH